MSLEYQTTDGLGNKGTIRVGPEKPDPRPVDIAAQGIRIANARGAAECAEAALAALESAGWRIVRLEQVGWVEARNDACPVYRITEEKP